MLGGSAVAFAVSREHERGGGVASCDSDTTEDVSGGGIAVVSDIVARTAVSLETAQAQMQVLKRFVDLVGRSVVVMVDYKWFYWQHGDQRGTAPTSSEPDPPGDADQQQQQQQRYQELLSAVHRRSASRFYGACVTHGGLLVKLGQYLSNLSGFLPPEYVDALTPLQDDCAPLPAPVVWEALPPSLRRRIRVFHPQPLGSASLAQVHRVTLWNHDTDRDGGGGGGGDDQSTHRDVVVKVQRPGLRASTRADLLALKLLSRTVGWAFPGTGFEWLLPEFHETIAAELDFTQELRNMQRCARMLKGHPLTTDTSLWNDWIRPNLSYYLGGRFLTTTTTLFQRSEPPLPPQAIVPVPIPELTTETVLTMSFEEGFRVTDLDQLRRHSIDPQRVATATCALFGDLLFVHGFVHADPHPGNLLVRPRPASASSKEGEGAFDLVLLDHGMYRRLTHRFRRDYCDLWAGLVGGRREQALRGVRGMGQDDALLDVLSLFLVYRLPTSSSSSSQKLGQIMNPQERRELRRQMKDKFGDEAFSKASINNFMESLPRDFLFCLRCNNLVRGINRSLGGTSLHRFVAFGAAASRGTKIGSTDHDHEDDDEDASLWLSLEEVDRLTGSDPMVPEVEEEGDHGGYDGDALHRAKNRLNRPVASELLMTNASKSNNNEDGGVVATRRRGRPFADFLESYKMSLQVWYHSLLLDFIVWCSQGLPRKGANDNEVGGNDQPTKGQITNLG